MYSVSVLTNDTVEVNGEKLQLDIAQIDATKWHIIVQHKSYNIENVSINKQTKTATIKVNNNSYDIVIKDKFDLLLSQLGMADLAIKKVKDLKAPMPGLVVDVLVGEGQKVAEGDKLVILEAMKMENILKSPLSGKIKAITIKKNQTVEKNQLLLTFE